MNRYLVVFCLFSLFGFVPTGFSREKTAYVYECKQDFIFGRLWLRWIYVDTIPARDVNDHELSCNKPQPLGGNICLSVVDEDKNVIPCNATNFGRYAYWK